MSHPKYVFVTGGVVSSLGKGITAASLGRLLKARGYRVSMQKMDPYYNVDPGLLSPLQHGEAFITDDGVAADLDLGHYERFIDVNLRGEASMTTGKIHKRIMQNEFNGLYKGGTVQVIPHVTNEIKRAIRDAAAHSGCDVAIIEIGGTVGDMESMPYMEAIRQFRWDVGYDDCCFIHVTLLPYISAAGELKTKPTQHSVKNLRSIGIQPDVIVCRTEIPISAEAKDKIALFCNVKTGNVVQNLDAKVLYEVPVMLEKEGLADIVCRELKLPESKPDLADWREMLARYATPEREVRVALVGKYVALHDAYLSVAEALVHAGIANHVAVHIDWIASDTVTRANAPQALGGYDAIVAPGGYGHRGAEGIVATAGYARETGVPFLAIGFGMQLAVVEAVRSLLGMPDAASAEVNAESATQVATIPRERVCHNDSRSASRMGGFDIDVTGRLAGIYGASTARERHGNRYEIVPEFEAPLAQKGFLFTGREPKEGYLEAFEAPAHPFYFGVIYHPEFLSRPNRAHPLFAALIRAAMERK